MMRVAMVCPYSLSCPGGVQGQAAGLAKALSGLGHRVTLIAPDDERAPGVYSDGELGMTTVAVGGSTGVRANGSVAPVCLWPPAVARADRSVRHGTFDVVHLHEPLAPALAYPVLLRQEAPVVGTFHRAGESAAYRVAGPVARLLAGRLAVRCAVSETAAETAAAVLGGRYELLFNGIDTTRFAAAGQCRSEAPSVLFVGRHEHRKGLGVLLRAFERLPPPAELWIVGDGPEGPALRRRHPESDRIHWLGRLDDAAAADRFVRARVLCAPSLHGESFGVVLLEAMAARCAVVASDIPGYRAAAAGHATLVPPGDVDALAASLAVALGGDTDGQRPDAGGQAFDAAAAHAERWSMERLAARYVEIYDRARCRLASGN